ncbi:septum formation inhibitor Maf [Paenibacillus sp. HJL G12]|uniref:dTTP/UTP pyrophosphatase n=1 Tax=Paenibacillus dendrobii TaxID=2691084 RepID=A0A7X3IR54_9BACL|nr:Maf family protein [Paenibacillus dendrobii]MWV46727.1 septum formation inhibitor Maf [Paenibacillus dendrobii]
MKSDHSRRIVLASTSPRRQELIASLHIPYEIRPSHADEHTPGDWTPQQIVEGLALRKAQAVYSLIADPSQNAVVVGSDTIVVLEDQVLGKPVDDADAFRMLKSLQGKTHHVYTGVACIDAANGQKLVRHQSTKVRMKELSDQKIDAYVRSGEPGDKAGAYGIQGLGATLVERIEGCYFTVVGLPLSLLSDMLSEFGIDVL